MIIEIITSILFLLFLYKARKSTEDLSEKYDEETITPSDYTLYFEITDKLNKSWDSSPFYQAEMVTSSRGEQFKNWINNEIADFNMDK